MRLPVAIAHQGHCHLLLCSCIVLQTLEVEGLERCNLRSGLPPAGEAPAAAEAAPAGAGCDPALPLLPPLTNVNLRSISLISSDTLQVGGL